MLVLVLSVYLVPSVLGDEGSGGSGMIIEVKTAGNRAVSTALILSKIRSRVGQLFDAEMASADAERIAELSGVESCYYNTEVVNGRIQLTFVVLEKNIVRSIKFVGNKKIKSKKLTKKVGFELADYVDALVAESGRKEIEKFYKKKGYAFVDVKIDAEKLSFGQVLYEIIEGQRVKVKSVVYRGNAAINSKDLAKVVKSKKKKFIFWSAYYVEEKVAEDVTKLQGVYYKRGFLDSTVTAAPKFSDDKSEADIVFNIREGSMYGVAGVTISGNRFFTTEDLFKDIKLAKGQTYNSSKADSDVKQLQKRYREIGFIDSKVEKNMRFISSSSVSVDYAISEGERFRIAQINISGNEQVQDRVVRRILDEYEFQPGNWYNADHARGDGKGYLETLVQQNTYSEEVSITPTGDIAGQRDAQVNVIEGQTGSVMVGAGVSTDSGVIGQLIYNQRNFDISDTPESFGELITGKAFRGAGQTMRIALEPGTEVSQYSVSFTEPYFQDKPVSLDVVGSRYMRVRESYDEERTKGYFGFEERLKNKWRRSIGFRGENVEVSDIEADAPVEIVDVKGDNHLLGVRLGVGRNTTIDRYNPSQGYIFDVGYEQVGGDHTFGILSGTYRQYYKLYENIAEHRTILATKLHAATTVNDAPPFEKFYAGGQGSLRGFDYRGVSTRGKNPVSGELDDPIGSDWLFLANAEVAVPLTNENFALLFFVDSGLIDTGSYRAAAGTGIQILIPQWFGPVPMRFELATPFMKEDEDDTQIFSFSIGRLF
jgi:outer membrane protein insertion porin family